MLELVVISTLNGILFGMLLFLMASGLTVIFSMLGVLNFAHASFYMLGAFFGFQISRWFGFWPALFIAPILAGALGAAVERFGLRHVHRHGPVAEILFTFGLAYLIEEFVIMVWGRSSITNAVPEALNFSLFSTFGTTFPAYKGFMMAVSVAMFVFLWLALKRTRIGLIIQAALTHPQMVGALGHNVPAVFVLVFAIGSALAGMAGVIGGFAFLTAPTMAASLGPIVFVVIVVGGLGSLPGALLASMLLGVIQTFAVAVDYSLLDVLRLANIELTKGSMLHEVAAIKLAQAAPIIPYLLLVLVLILRPTGLMGTRE